VSSQLDKDCVEVGTVYGTGVVVDNWRDSHIKLPWGKLYAPKMMSEIVDFRRFNIPHIWGGVCWGNSAGVDCLIKSGVSKYLDFKTLPSLEMAISSTSKLVPIPASKGAVFSSPHLTPMEKRRLMRACRVAYDAVSGSAATEVNDDERKLTYSSSMPRPQNAKAVGDRVTEGNWKEWLTKECGVDGGIVNDILSYGLTLTPEANTSTKTAVALLHKHVSSLSFYDKDGTAFIVPMYGMSEIVHGFARRTAVGGGVMILGCKGRIENGEVVLDSVVEEGEDEGGAMFKAKKTKINKGWIEEEGEKGGSRVWRLNCLVKGGKEGSEGGIVVHPPGYTGLSNPVQIIYGGATLKWTKHRDYNWVTASVLADGSAKSVGEALKKAVEELGVQRVYSVVVSFEVGDGDGSTEGKWEVRRFTVPRPPMDITMDSAVAVASKMYNVIKEHDGTITTDFMEGGVEDDPDGGEDWEAERMEEAGKALEEKEDEKEDGGSDDDSKDDELARAVANL